MLQRVGYLSFAGMVLSAWLALSQHAFAGSVAPELDPSSFGSGFALAAGVIFMLSQRRRDAGPRE